MRYGTIITTAFYGIILPKKDVNLIDGYFLGASHHRIRAINALDVKTRDFHSSLYWRHVQALMQVIARGDFTDVFMHDSVTKKGCHRPEGWLRVMQVDPSQVSDPEEFDHLLPDNSLFRFMAADLRHLPGHHYPYDVLLKHPEISPSQIPLEPTAA
jgi:hypothetical protein